jgi:stage V sporulation protein AC
VQEVLFPLPDSPTQWPASAIEFRAEGQVFGIGCKIFTIAGPVILYGILSAWGLGVIYYILKILEVIS